MKSLLGKIPQPPLFIATLLLTAAVFLACGPATQSAPGEQPGSKPAQEKSTPEPTPPPTDVIVKTEGGDGWREIIGVTGGSIPKPTPKYPEIRDSQLQRDVVELEATKEAQDQAMGGASGARGEANAVDDPVIVVKVYLTANTLTVADWLRSNGVNPANVREYEDGSGGRFSASVPLRLLGTFPLRPGTRN